MLKYNMKNCNSLVLFTSESCNLQCSYCEIAKHINNQNKHIQENIKIKSALLDKTYLNNIKVAFDKLQINPLNIKQLELWGQEPTLTLKETTTFLLDLYNFIPNIEKIIFSTNGTDSNNIIFFIKNINDLFNKKVQLNIQFSYDGAYLTKKNRKIDPNIIINNIKSIIKEFQNYNLNNIYFNIQLHNVIDKNSFLFFAKDENKEEFYKYLLEFDQIFKELRDLNRNPHIHITPFWSALENPIEVSSEEGKIFFNFLKKCKNMPFDFIQNFCMPTDIIHYPLRDEQVILNLVQESTKQGCITANNIKNLEYLSRKRGCNFNNTILKLRYDGTLIHCQNALPILSMEKNEADNLNNTILLRKKNKQFFPNIITSSEEELNNYFYQTNLRSSESFLPAFSQVCSFLKILLETQQIDNKYKNSILFFQAAIILTFSHTCPHTSMVYSGNLYGINFNTIRLLCNGAIDLMIENYNERKLKN